MQLYTKPQRSADFCGPLWKKHKHVPQLHQTEKTNLNLGSKNTSSLPECLAVCVRVRLPRSQNRHKAANQHLSGYALQERVATFKPTCVSILIATQGLLVLSLLRVSDVKGAWCTRRMMTGTNLILKKQYRVLLFFKKLHKSVDPLRPEQMSAVDHSVGPEKEQLMQEILSNAYFNGPTAAILSQNQ